MIRGKRKSLILDFESYEICDSGEVINLRTSRPEIGFFDSLSQRVDRAGYLTVRLTSNGRTSTKFVHRLLAEHFVPNPEKKPIINHRNGVKTDNRLANLEFVTHQENVAEAYKLGLNSRAKRVVNKADGVVYQSIAHASKMLGIKYHKLARSLKIDGSL